jgi:hypothetical protein
MIVPAFYCVLDYMPASNLLPLALQALSSYNFDSLFLNDGLMINRKDWS